MLKKFGFLIAWTAEYGVFVALAFHVLFNFQIWSAPAWDNLARATIRGIDGLAFGAAIISIIPIYLATIRYIWKNNALPFKIPKPIKKSKPEPVSGADGPTDQIKKKYVFPDNLPDELREPYIRIHGGILTKNAVDLIQSKTAEVEITETAPDSFMPLPPSFDAPDDSAASMPVFRDISFDEENPIEISEENGKKIATYVFDDPDFWVADDENDWFAAGKQISSPIRLLKAADADERVLILQEKNIMNLDNNAADWEKQGIKIIYNFDA